MTELLRTDNTILRTQCDRRRELNRTKRKECCPDNLNRMTPITKNLIKIQENCHHTIDLHQMNVEIKLAIKFHIKVLRHYCFKC